MGQDLDRLFPHASRYNANRKHISDPPYGVYYWNIVNAHAQYVEV